MATSPPNNIISSDRQGVKISLVFFVGWYLYLHSAPYKLIRISIGCTWRTAPHSYAGICHRSSGGHISQQTHSDHHHTITHHHPLCYIIIQTPLLCNICFNNQIIFTSLLSETFQHDPLNMTCATKVLFELWREDEAGGGWKR